MTQGEYLGWLAAADCVLDTPHYCGGANTTYDAFAVAAPVVTLRGEFHRGRYTAAAYGAMGLSDLVAGTADEYVDRALRFTAEPDFRRQVRKEIANRRKVLFENLAAVHELQHWFLEAIAQTR
jgi:predicted O-linked N-acetylglucosamine transferase (SPINDLY family)